MASTVSFPSVFSAFSQFSLNELENLIILSGSYRYLQQNGLLAYLYSLPMSHFKKYMGRVQTNLILRHCSFQNGQVQFGKGMHNSLFLTLRTHLTFWRKSDVAIYVLYGLVIRSSTDFHKKRPLSQTIGTFRTYLSFFSRGKLCNFTE